MVSTNLLEDHISNNATIFTSTHTLAETFNTLLKYTNAQQAADLLNMNLPVNILGTSETVYRKAIKRCVSIKGRGMIYDALHLTVAEAVQCEELYTFNTRHYNRFDAGFGIVSP